MTATIADAMPATIADAYDIDSMPDHIGGSDPEPEVLDPESAHFVHSLVIRMLQFMDALVGHPLHPYQRRLAYRILESLVWQNKDGTVGDGETITALMARQSGKALDTSTPILTPRGWTTMGDLRVGDSVYAPDGTATEITATSPVFTDHDCYEVVFKDGQRIVADADHRWTVIDRSSSRKRKGPQTVTLDTKTLAAACLTVPDRGYRYAVPVAAPFNAPEADLPLDPYLLGAWLGDGSSYKGEITSADEEVVDYFREAGFFTSYAYPAGRATTYGLLGLYAILRRMGLIADGETARLAPNKHIPDAYLLASPKQRWSLLQGLLDTDGHAGQRGHVEFCSTNPALAEQTLFLARSLGFKATIIESRATLNGRDCGPRWRVSFTAYRNESPFRLERKTQALGLPPTTPGRHDRVRHNPIVAVTRVETRPTKCIAVAHPSHLYLAGKGLVATHNTETVADCVATAMILLPVLAKRYPSRLGKYKDGLWVGCFAPVADQSETLFSRIVSRLTSERATEILSEGDLGEKAEGGGKLMTLRKSKSFIRMQTAHRRANIESKTYHLIVIDEAQNCDSFVISKSIYPMGASTNATFIKTGTPTTVRGDFYDNIRLNLRLQTQRGAKQNHFQADYREVCKYNKNYARYIEKEKRRIGEDSDEFQLAYSLKWLLERGMLTTQAVLDNLGDVSMRTFPTWTKTPVLIGVDPARRQDSTVVTAVYVNWDYSDEDGYFEHRVLNWLEMHGEDWEDQYARIVEFCSNYNVLRVIVDKQGMGDLVESRLRRLMPYAEVVGYDSTLPAQSARWKHLITLLDKRLLSWPAHAETRRTRHWKRFRQQMEEAEKNYKGPNIVVAAPNETDAHDDYVDSLALACFGSQDATMPSVEVSESPFFSR